MFGLLGGLIGGAMRRSMPVRRPLMGLLSRRMSGGGSGTQSTSSAPRNQVQQEQPGQPEEKKQEAPESQPVDPAPQPSPPTPPPMVEKASNDIQEVAEQRQQATEQPQQAQDTRPVTAGLLDDGPTVADRSPPLGSKEQPQVESRVNQTEEMTPVATPAGEKFPSTPPMALSGLIDKVGEIPDRRTFPMEDPNPSKPADTTSQAAYTQGSPSYHYQTLGSWTALTPNFSYKR